MARKRKSDGGGGGSSFTVLFASLSVLLLAFFILLNSMAVIDEQKVRKALGSMLGSFGILPGGFLFEKGTGLLPFASPIVRKEMAFQDTLSELEKYLVESGMGDDASIEQSKQGVVITIASKVMFSSGSADVDPKAYKIFDRISKLIKVTKNHVRIEGHTDNVPIKTDKFPSNWELSTARAVSVLRYILSKEDISPDRFSAVGYGEYYPLVKNNTLENRAKNRRVNIVFIGNIEEVESGTE